MTIATAVTAAQSIEATATDRPMSPDEARRIALGLIHEHGLVGWKVKFDNAAKRAGQCRYRDMTISLSLHLMAHRPAGETMDTITHEIAHALTPGHHHDAVWARKHRELGGKGERYFHLDVADPKAKFHGTCPHGKVFNRYKGEHPGNRLGCNCKTGRRRTPATHTIAWRENA